MIEVDDVFAMLLADVWDKQGSAPLYLHPTGIRVNRGEMVLAADHQGHRHLLVPMGENDKIDEQPGRSLTWSRRSLAVGGKTHIYADLSCLDTGLMRVFSGLVRDALERAEKDPDHALASVEQALCEWRRLLAQSRPMSEESARGLYGELVILERLATIDANRAVACWSGPDRESQDFRSVAGAVEVKTSVRDDMSVKISSLGQLDSAGISFLVLAYVRIEQGSPHEDSLDSVIERLIEAGVPQLQLLEKVAAYGHVYQEGVNDRFRFGVVDQRFWAVNENFPGLRYDDIPPERRDAVSDLTYRLSLVGAPDELGSDGFRDRMKELLLVD